MYNLYLVQDPTAGALMSPLFMMLIVGLVFYFLIFRPQKKQRKEYEKTMESLKVGDIVVTRAGARGRIIELNEKTFILETGNNNTQIEYLRQAISYIDNDGATTQSNTAANNNFNKTNVGNLSYGNDEVFINKLNELKNNHTNEQDYDLLLEDVFEYIVKENETSKISVQNKFRLEDNRTDEIFNQLEYLGIISAENENKNRDILIDPRR